MAKNLLIVESPSKAKTLKKYLGGDFEILASYGHVRDLVPKNGAVDPEHDFAMKYELIKRNAKHVDAIVAGAKEAENIYLATDPDREGEAISWHLFEILKSKRGLKNIKPQRVVFHEITKNAVGMARAKGISSINMDLIYGLPYQTLESFKATLDKALTLSPDRLAVFNYAHVPWIKKSMRKFDEATLPSPKTKLEILKYTAEFFIKNGYKMIGMDHFAKPGDELFGALANGTLHRNFQGYTTKGGADLIGIGLTSIGEGQRYYAQNFKDMDEYEKALDSGVLPYCKGIYLTGDDLIRKAVIMSLMSNFALDIKAVEAKFDIKFFEYFKDDLVELENLSEFVTVTPEKISVNETGTLIIRNIAMCFDAYLKKIPENLRRFSKTV